MKKDSRPAVRKVALHLEVDAISELDQDDMEANGFIRNRPGGQEARTRPRSMKRGRSEAIQLQIADRADRRRFR
jgi:hypothetical protein